MKKKTRQKQKEKRSLKTNLLFTVIFCWVLPLLVIIGIAGFYTSNQIRGQIINNITNSVSASAEICAAQIDSAVTASYAATYNPDIHTAYQRYVRSETGDYNSDDLYSDVTAYLKQQYRYDSQFDITMLYFSSEPDNIYYTYNESSGFTFLQYQKYHTNVHARIRQFADTLGNRVGFCNEDGQFYMVRNLVDSYTFTPYATLVMQLHGASAFENLTNVVYEKDATIWIGGFQLQLKGSPITQDEIKASAAHPNYNPSLITGNKRLSAGNLQYAIHINSSDILASLMHFQWVLLLMCLLVVPLLIWALRFFTHNVTWPITNFLRMYQELGRGNFGIHMEEDFSNRDFDHLSKDFNQMSDRLKSQFEQIYNDELALRDAKIMALQAQINPHFLNNTLELINWESRMIGNEKISSMIKALATMLNAAMSRKNTHLIPLSEEMKYVNSYLYIIGQLLGEKQTVENSVDESLASCMVPRLVMQPILENAVEHGVEAQRKGKIFIRAYRSEEFLFLEVENTGSMSKEDERKIKELLTMDHNSAYESSGNLGIHNVYQRLHILYGSRGNLEITSNETGNTIAKITIPFDAQNH